MRQITMHEAAKGNKGPGIMTSEPLVDPGIIGGTKLQRRAYLRDDPCWRPSIQPGGPEIRLGNAQLVSHIDCLLNLLLNLN